MVHLLCVPALVACAWQLLPPALRPLVGVAVTAGWVYLRPGAGLLAAAAYAACFWALPALSRVQAALGFAMAAILQVVLGHAVFEGRKPAFMECVGVVGGRTDIRSSCADKETSISRLPAAAYLRPCLRLPFLWSSKPATGLGCSTDRTPVVASE